MPFPQMSPKPVKPRHYTEMSMEELGRFGMPGPAPAPRRQDEMSMEELDRLGMLFGTPGSPGGFVGRLSEGVANAGSPLAAALRGR